MVSLAIEAKTTCGVCALPMPVNTLAPKVSCASCGRPAAVGTDFWKALFQTPLHDAPRMLARETRLSTVGSLRATYARMNPQCSGCQKEIPIESVREVNGQVFLPCDRCGQSNWVRAVPAELVATLPGVTHLVGEDPEPLPNGPAPAPDAAVFPCPQCGSPLPFDGVTRALTCRHCGAHAHVPDDFVYRGRTRTAKRWFLCFDPSISDAAPLPRGVDAGLFSWKGLAQGVVDAEGNLYCACMQVPWLPSSEFSLEQGEEFVIWSVDSALNVRWVRRDLRYKVSEDLRVIFSPPGELLITDVRCSAQLRLSCADGSTVAEIGGPKPAIVEGPALYEDLTCAPDGSVLMLKEGRLLRLDRNGKEIPTWSEGKGATGDGHDRLSELHDHPIQLETLHTQIHVGFDGSVYLVQGELSRYEADGRKAYCVELPFSADHRYNVLGADSRGCAYVLSEDVVLRSSPSGACEAILKRELGGLPIYEMNLAVAPDGSFWLFGTGGLVRKLAPDGTVLFASGHVQQPPTMTYQELYPQIQETFARAHIPTEAELRTQSEAILKAQTDQIAQIMAQEQKRERRDSNISLLVGLIVLIACVAIFIAMR